MTSHGPWWTGEATTCSALQVIPSWKYLKSTSRKAAIQPSSKSSSKSSCPISHATESAGMSWARIFPHLKRKGSESGGLSREAIGIKSRKSRNDLYLSVFLCSFDFDKQWMWRKVYEENGFSDGCRTLTKPPEHSS